MQSRRETQPLQGQPARRPILKYEGERSERRVLALEPRRALAVLRALDLSSNRAACRSLLDYSGAPMRREGSQLLISHGECEAVAEALRRDGYPLDDEGISRFKEERGYSRVVRIGPDIAAAYAHWADGLDVRLAVSSADLRRLDIEGRRALRILLLIGRVPERLIAVRAALGLDEREPARDGTLPVGRVSAKAVLDWAQGYGISFTNAGLNRLTAVLEPTRRTSSNLEAIAEPVARWIIAEDEPIHDYMRLAASTGDLPALLNRRTYLMLAQAEAELGRGALRILRGSYESERERGAHPHQGGGVVDLEIADQSPEGLVRCIRALRSVGFAAWFRPRRGRPHIHAIAIGDRDLAPCAQWQLKGYFQGRDGRSRSEPDPHAKLAVVLPHWVRKHAVRYQCEAA